MLFCGIDQLYAQNDDYIFRHITVNEGLISQNVTAICQDRAGFIWIGTSGGLQRYDGTRFKNYLADIRDTAALQSDWISSIFEDSKNRLWIGNDHGAPYIFNRITEKFYNYNLHAPLKNKINGIWHFAEDKNGGIWIAGHEGYYHFNETTNQFERYNELMGLEKHIQTSYITIDGNNNLWLATSDGIKLYDQKEKKLYSRENNPLQYPFFNIKESISNIIPDGNDLWVSTGNRIGYRYNYLTKKIKAYTFNKLAPGITGQETEKEILGQVCRLPDGKIIIPLLGRGLAIYQPGVDSFYVINADVNQEYAYHLNEGSPTSVCVIQDREKNIIIGNENGINICNPGKRYFFSHGTNDRSISKEPISDFLEMPDGNIFMSFYSANGGIVKMDSAYNIKRQYLVNKERNENSRRNQIWNLFKDETGIIWAPNQRNTILKLDPGTNKLIEEDDSLFFGPIITMKQDDPGVFWLGHWSKGLVKAMLSSHKRYYYNQFLYSDSNVIKRVQSILLDGDKIWVGTFQNGLQLFDKGKEKFIEAFISDEKNKAAISSNSINDILRYSRDTLVLATEMGVNIFDEKNKTFKAITVKEGLPNNIAFTVIKDEMGDLWVAFANGGLCKINMHTLAVTIYNENDGITNNAFASKFCSLKNGDILIGAAGGFISFNPTKFKTSFPPPDVSITGIHIFEKELMIDSLLSQHIPLELSYKENSLRIEFASLQFWEAGTISYFYKLEGVDNDWIQADKSHAAIYNQLKDGTYAFTVKCANKDGTFCNSITKLKIIIQAPFWKTWWFITLAFLAFFLLIYWFIKFRENNIKAIDEAKLKVQQTQIEMYSMNEQLSKAKLEALRSQMNPHFIFNSLNAIQECILTNKVDAAYEYLSKFSKLQRMVLNNSEKELIPLSSEIEMLQLYLSLESLRFSKSFTYHIDAAGITDADEIMIPSMITQPFVENAIWHGLRNKEGEKTLTIVYEELEGQIIITINDNGIGREKAAMIKNQKLGSGQFDSKGTMLLQQRLNVLSQQFKTNIRFVTTDKKNEAGDPSGTKVIISFPSNLETT